MRLTTVTIRLFKLAWGKRSSHMATDGFDFNFQSSVTKRQMQQLLDFQWIDKAYNVIFLGPPGVGKTHLAVSLGVKAIESGYKAIFITMDELIKTLKTEEVLVKSRTRLKQLRNADLVIIDGGFSAHHKTRVKHALSGGFPAL